MNAVGVNGAGRIGRQSLLLNHRHHGLPVTGLNEPFMKPAEIAHLMKFDSGQGTAPEEITSGQDWIAIAGTKIPVFAEKDPAAIQWGASGADLVLECSGVFTARSAAAKHHTAGAKVVLISAPSDDADIALVYGVNHGSYVPGTHTVVSAASCTTNCLAPVVKVIVEKIGFVRAWMNTTHAFTADQRLQDAPHKDLRRARAAGSSIIPTSTGAAKMIGKIFTALDGKIDGSSFRVPVITGSIVDLAVDVGRAVTVDEANAHFRDAAAGELRGVLHVSELPLVSVDFIGTRFASIVDSALTSVVDGQLLHISSWYDNESSFVSQYLRTAEHILRAA